MSEEDRFRSTLRSTAAGDLDLTEAPPRAPSELRYTLNGPPRLGGMGEVYAAHDEVLRAPVALKLLAGAFADRPSYVRRFQAEAWLTASLAHPSIVPVHDIGLWLDGRPYYTMRWEGGARLDARITALQVACHGAGPGRWRPDADGFTLRRLVELLAIVADAVAHAHALGVVHRDLKPSNIVVSGPAQVAVLDWGLAWRADWGAEGAGEACGTAGYAPPQQVRPETLPDPSWDVYALGATLYQILSGERPYGRGAPLHAALLGPPRPVQEVSDLPLDPGLVEIVERAMAEPAIRYPDARDLAEALRGWLDGDARRARGLAVVAEADGLLQEVEKIRSETCQKFEFANRQMSELNLHAPEDLWRPVWALEDEARALRVNLALREVELMERLQAALAHDPELPEARARLARVYQSLHAEAEAKGNEEEAARWERLIQEHHQGALQEYLVGDGWLSLETDPPGAEVIAARYTRDGRREVPGPARSLGRTPLQEVVLPMGSWLLTLRAPGRAEVTVPVCYPVFLGRQGRWPDPPEGEPLPGPVYLPEAGALGPEDAYVPAGWFQAGGDPKASRPRGPHRRWADGFVIRRDPVTVGEYLDFLNDLSARGPVDPQLVPRERAVAGLGDPLIGWDGLRFVLDRGDGSPVCESRQPVINVTWHAARAYAAWAAERDGLPWQLPLADWMEKAARGVDGRAFPMGNLMIPVWSWTRDSAADPPGPLPVEALRDDESPYGVFGLSGNVRSWCEDWQDEKNVRARGGAWSYPVDACRAASCMWHTPDTRIENLGLRLARRLPDESR